VPVTVVPGAGEGDLALIPGLLRDDRPSDEGR
jgi:hypothetical protein